MVIIVVIVGVLFFGFVLCLCSFDWFLIALTRTQDTDYLHVCSCAMLANLPATKIKFKCLHCLAVTVSPLRFFMFALDRSLLWCVQPMITQNRLKKVKA